ncbi:MAG: hypothetical protein JWP27_2566 [Flaviaesturariibacter sp.]|nr:hypothetical protein [Flaviaesturariibacter sp.]
MHTGGWLWNLLTHLPSQTLSLKIVNRTSPALPLSFMERVTLQFQTPQDLTNFRKSVLGKPIETDIHNLTLTCECSPTDIALAMNSFGARVIEKGK